MIQQDLVHRVVRWVRFGDARLVPCRHSQVVTISFSKTFTKFTYVGESLHVGDAKIQPSSGAESSMGLVFGEYTLEHCCPQDEVPGSEVLRSFAHLSSTPPGPPRHHTLSSYNTKQL